MKTAGTVRLHSAILTITMQMNAPFDQKSSPCIRTRIDVHYIIPNRPKDARRWKKRARVVFRCAHGKFVRKRIAIYNAARARMNFCPELPCKPHCISTNLSPLALMCKYARARRGKKKKRRATAGLLHARKWNIYKWLERARAYSRYIYIHTNVGAVCVTHNR